MFNTLKIKNHSNCIPYMSKIKNIQKNNQKYDTKF